VYVPGCAVRPEAIIDGVVRALDILEAKRRFMTESEGRIDKLIVERAEKKDLPEILALQKVAYQSEAELYTDDSVPALRQTLAEMEKDFERMTFLKGIVNGKIVTTIRGYDEDGSAHLLRLSVHPYFQGRGLGARMIHEIESVFPLSRRFEIFTGHKSTRNIGLYAKLGYKQFKTEPFNDEIQWVYMEKVRS
jgi:ribosomal protein S18 acetylase RimI-like enzyme